MIERVLVQFCAFKIGNTIGEFTLKAISFPEPAILGKETKALG